MSFNVTPKLIRGDIFGGDQVMKRILTYGTFDLLHYGHIRLLKRARELGDYLVVAVSTDEFNRGKNKKSYHSYNTRKEMLEAIRYVDLVIPEESWEQKIDDVLTYKIDTVVMGGDWMGSDRFEFLKDYCELTFLDRTEGISTSQIKGELNLQPEEDDIDQLPESMG
jgi:choline-phosphate cytidylyltransferase/glycerol-3-phosphate cytidylyltransferase